MDAPVAMLVWWAAAVVLAGAARVLHRRWWHRRAVGRLGERDRPRCWWPTAPRARLVGATERLVGRRRRRASIADDVAPTLESIARALAAGVGLGGAVQAVSPSGSGRPFAAVLAAAAHEHRLGADLGAALAGVATPAQRRVPEVALGLAVLEVAATHGGAAAAALHRAATAVRERRTVHAERAVHSAQARLSAVVLTLVPVAFGSWTAATDPRVAHFLFGTPAGAACLLVGLGVNLGGWWWMRRVIRGRD